jgi:cold shock CspA family protein
MNGIVKHYYKIGGTGTIAPLIGKPNAVSNINFHADCLERDADGEPIDLGPGDEVSFELAPGVRGKKTINIKLVHRHKERTSLAAGPNELAGIAQRVSDLEQVAAAQQKGLELLGKLLRQHQELIEAVTAVPPPTVPPQGTLN